MAKAYSFRMIGLHWYPYPNQSSLLMPKSNQSNVGTQWALSNQMQSWAGYALDILGFTTLFKHIVSPPKFDADNFYSQAFMQIKQLC